MDKISLNNSKYNNFKNDQDRIKVIKQTIVDKTGIMPESIKVSNGKIIVSTNNNYEAIEIRMQMQEFLDDHNIKVV